MAEAAAEGNNNNAQQVMATVSTMNDQVLEQGQEISRQAEARLASFSCLKNELDSDMGAIVEQIQALKTKVKRNIRSEKNPNGKLTQSKQAYKDSLEFDRRILENLLEADLVHWQSGLAAANEDMERFQGQMREILARFQQDFDRLLQGEREVRPPQFSLRKLPIFGQQIRPDEVEFDWPQKMLLEQMPAEVYLQSLEFKAGNGVGNITSIRCNFSNGHSSPFFQKEGNTEDRLANPQTLQFDQNRPIRKVGAFQGATFSRIYTFFDAAGAEVMKYDPGNSNEQLVDHEIGEHEEIIGVYGKIAGSKAGCNNKGFIASLGFILKVRSQ